MICFIWEGFPQYAARCVGAFVKATSEKVVVVATIPVVPIKGMEEQCQCPVHWVPKSESRSIAEICGEMPRVAVVSGWGYPHINRLAAEVRAAGGKTIAMCDNNFMLDCGICTFKMFLAEIARMLRFRFMIRRRFDGFFVPGKSGLRLMRFYGVGKSKVRAGMYAADASLFSGGKPLLERPKKILFVGSIDARKNIVPFSRAFLSVPLAKRQGWQLEICGRGTLRPQIPNDPAIIVHDFVQPEQLAAIYQSARVLALPSRIDHWGLVVHEGVLAGCALLLGDNIGAKEDFLEEGINGFSFDPSDLYDMRQAIERILLMDERQWTCANETSLLLSKSTSLSLFVQSMKELTE